MNDNVLNQFLITQHGKAEEFNAASDIARVRPIGGWPPRHYFADFQCRTLVKQPDGEVAIANHAAVGIYFPPDYLIRAHTAQVLTLIGPSNVFHPNIKGPAICIGRMQPAMDIVSLLYQIFETLSFLTFSTSDALDPVAAAYVRQHLNLFPTDNRPLCRPKAIAR